ncbi:hypothetical protein CEQ90_06690 [Lewinellaceae bacterium SD302]|nr:hypothetical protein CEQ90_06690 [Lewinellaceae bacterium SD302]
MNILGIIPARAGSKRLPGKNKRPLAGKELVRYAIEAALNSQLVTDWVLTTDDEDILRIGQEYDGLRLIRRPDELCTDEAMAITYVQHALKSSSKKYSHTVITQVTSPFTLAEDIDGTLALLLKSQVNSAVSIEKLDFATHPAKMKLLDGHRLRPYLEEEKGRMAASQLPTIYVRNGSVYCSTIKSIEAGEIVSTDCTGYLMPRERSLDINDPIDFAFAEFLMGRKETKNKTGTSSAQD